MRKIREYLRLRFEGGLSARQIAASLQVSRSSVGEYDRRFAASGLRWPLPAGLSDSELERRLFPRPPAVPADTRVVPPGVGIAVASAGKVHVSPRAEILAEKPLLGTLISTRRRRDRRSRSTIAVVVMRHPDDR